jgi:hypothetical protein
VILPVELDIVDPDPLHSYCSYCSCGFDVVDEVDAYSVHCCCCIDSLVVRHMDQTLAFHSDHVVDLEAWVDRSMAAFVVVVAGVDYGKADIQDSELVDLGMIV